MEYTKGEWEVDRGGTSDYLNLIFSQGESGEHLIGQLSNGKSNYATVTVAEGEANSNLIAAAPDMYEALWGMVKAWEELHPDLHPNMAKLALAKAEGK